MKKNHTILVVDDENGVRQSFNMVLKDDYNVLLADTGRYLFHPKGQLSFRPFCRTLRSMPEGEKRCWECDRDAALKAAQEGHPIVYPCHAGFVL